MAYIGSGLGGQFGLAEEAVVGTVQAPDHFYEFESETLGAKKKVVQAEGIRAGGLYDRGAGRYVTQRWAEGDLNINFPNKGAGLLLRHMLGSAVVSPSQVSGAAYSSVHTPGLKGGKSLSLQIGRPPLVGTTPEPFTYPGAKITDWELSCAQSDLLKLKATFDCWDELTLATTPASPALATATVPTASFFTFVQGTLKQGGTVNTVTTPAPVTPTQTAPATATTGGTLAAATYYIKIAALNATGETVASSEQSITTTGATSTITANWSAVSNATQIKVYVGTAAGAENKYLLAAGAATTLTITSLTSALTGTPLVTATAVSTTVTSVTGGTTLGYIRSIKFGGKSGLKTDNYFLGSGTTKGEQNQNAYNALTGSIDLEFGSRALYDLYRSDAPVTLELSFVGANIPTTSTPYSLDIVLPQVWIEDGISPNVAGPDVLMMTAPLTATSNDTDPVVQITYTSSDTAL